MELRAGLVLTQRRRCWRILYYSQISAATSAVRSRFAALIAELFPNSSAVSEYARGVEKLASIHLYDTTFRVVEVGVRSRLRFAPDAKIERATLGRLTASKSTRPKEPTTSFNQPLQ